MMAGKITGLEPDVQAFVDRHGLMMTTHDMVAVSQAISLKRIADALECSVTDSRFGLGLRIITNGDDQ